MQKIFVIDDEADVLFSIKAWCEKKGYEVTTFENSDGFLDALIDEKPDIVLIDINLKGDDGAYFGRLKKYIAFSCKNNFDFC